MTVEIYKKILSKLNREKALGRKEWIIHHWRGESCLSPYLPDIAEYTKSMGYINYVSTNTVVPLLSDKSYVTKLLNNLTRLNVSVDGYNQETLSLYRGVNASWKLLLKNLEVISSISTNCVKEMRVLMFKYNEGHEDFYRKLAEKYNMTRISFGRPIINYKMKLTEKEVETWLAENPKYQRYKQVNDDWVLKRGKCTMVKRRIPPVISVHGSVHPCGNDWGLQYNLGNVLTDDWNLIVQRFNKMKQVMRRKALSMCRNLCCVSNEKVDFTEEV